MCLFLSNLLAAVLGGVVSFVVWLITNCSEWFLPQIEISPNIVKRSGSPYEINVKYMMWLYMRCISMPVEIIMKENWDILHF